MWSTMKKTSHHLCRNWQEIPNVPLSSPLDVTPLSRMTPFRTFQWDKSSHGLPTYLPIVLWSGLWSESRCLNRRKFMDNSHRSNWWWHFQVNQLNSSGIGTYTWHGWASEPADRCWRWKENATSPWRSLVFVVLDWLDDNNRRIYWLVSVSNQSMNTTTI